MTRKHNTEDLNKSRGFSVMRLNRKLLHKAGFDSHGVSDATLKKFARRLSSYYQNNLRWLEDAAEDLKIPRIPPTPEEIAAEELQEHLVDLHIDEIVSKDRDVFNLGCFESPRHIVSKTSNGRLESSIFPKTRKVTHKWWYS